MRVCIACIAERGQWNVYTFNREELKCQHFFQPPVKSNGGLQLQNDWWAKQRSNEFNISAWIQSYRSVNFTDKLIRNDFDFTEF